MDIQKDMQNFSSHVMREYGESVLFNNHKPVDLRHAELFKAWQAAKANAVPEGFVLVLKEPNEEMIISGLAVVATGIGKHNIDEEIRKIWQKMIEAQESANEL